MKPTVSIKTVWQNRRLKRWLTLTAACVGVTIASGDPTPKTGTLVIAGGRLSPEHQAVYEAVLGAADAHQSNGTIGVIPLASGVPERSGPLTAQDFQQYTQTPQRVVNFPRFVHTDPGFANTQEAVNQIQPTAGLWFTGGDQSRITAAMRPAQGDARAYRSVLKVLARGGVIGGTSAGAAMMSDPMIRGGYSDDAMLLGATKELDGPGVCVGQGMGLFDFGLVDQHFLRRGRFGRLLTAMNNTGKTAGFGVSENAALLVDRTMGSITTIGPQAVTVIDLKQASRQGYRQENIRVSILGDGDRIDGRALSVTVAGSKQPIETPIQTSGSGFVVTFPDMWDPYVVAEMIKALSNRPDTAVAATDGDFDYRMTADQYTRFYRSPQDDGYTAVGVRLDVLPREGVESRAQARRQQLLERAQGDNDS